MINNLAIILYGMFIKKILMIMWNYTIVMIINQL